MSNDYKPTFPEAIDNTMRKVLVKCEMAAHYRFEMGLQAIGSSQVDLVSGKAFAKVMEAARLAFYRDGLGQEACVQKGIAAVYTDYPDGIDTGKSNKTAVRMAGALGYYFNDHPLALEELKPLRLPTGKYSVELSFAYPIDVIHPDTGRPVLYCGNFDMLAVDGQNQAWVVDEKTTSQMGDKWDNQWPLDSQMTGYCWGARKFLDGMGMCDVPVAGVVINGIAIRLRDYESRRLTLFKQDWEIERWHKQMVRDVNGWKEAYLLGQHDQALDHACAYYLNPCEFSPLCRARNPERLIEGSYEVKFWNPLERD